MWTSWVAVSINNIKTRASSEMTSRKNINFFSILMGWTLPSTGLWRARYLPSLIALLYIVSTPCQFLLVCMSSLRIVLNRNRQAIRTGTNSQRTNTNAQWWYTTRTDTNRHHVRRFRTNRFRRANTMVLDISKQSYCPSIVADLIRKLQRTNKK